MVGHLAAISAGGIAAGLSAELSGEEIARACIDCKADIVLVQTEAVLKKLLLVQVATPHNLVSRTRKDQSRFLAHFISKNFETDCLMFSTSCPSCGL